MRLTKAHRLRAARLIYAAAHRDRLVTIDETVAALGGCRAGTS
jgi:hypothetical protein